MFLEKFSSMLRKICIAAEYKLEFVHSVDVWEVPSKSVWCNLQNLSKSEVMENIMGWLVDLVTGS